MYKYLLFIQTDRSYLFLSDIITSIIKTIWIQIIILIFSWSIFFLFYTKSHKLNQCSILTHGWIWTPGEITLL